MLSSSGSEPPSSEEKPSCVSGVVRELVLSEAGASVVRLEIAFLFESLDFFLETLNGGILFLQILDTLIQSTVLLK
jgi:hypothetical protein